MHPGAPFRLLVGLAAATGSWARFLPDWPPVTPGLEARQETATSTSTTMSTEATTASTRSIPPLDPWQCITENVTSYFDIVRPTAGPLFDALDSYGFEAAAPCRASATADYQLASCTVSDPQVWCGFTTAAPAAVLSGPYAEYLSEVVAFWAPRSETFSVLATSCAVAWKRFSPGDRFWLGLATAHAECYLSAHPLPTSTRTSTVLLPSSTTSSTASSSTSSSTSSTTSSSTSSSTSSTTSSSSTLCTTSSTMTSTSTSTSSSATGISTPTPTHPGGMATNCNKFTLVNPGDTCNVISFFNGPIATEHFVVWNRGVGGMSCNALQVGTHVCVGVAPIPGQTNALPTPAPVHPGMAANCNKFAYVNPGDTCNVISFFNGPIATEHFVVWNRGVGGMSCNTLQVGTYACVGVAPIPGQTNALPTPAPVHPGMAANCNKFAYVNPGDTCNGIAFFNGPIATEDFVLWNRGTGGMACNALQAGSYACVGLERRAGQANAVPTPQPAHPGMVTNCKKFVYVNPGDSCDSIAFWNGVAGTQWVKLWNAGVGANCETLQANTYACIAVIS